MSLRGGAVSSGLCVGVCGLLLHGEGLCRPKDRFMRLMRSFYRPAYDFGGGYPFVFYRRFFPRINSRYGVGFLRNVVPVVDY